MSSTWSSKHVVSRTDVPFGVTTFKFNISHIFQKLRKNYSKNRQFQAKTVKTW